MDDYSIEYMIKKRKGNSRYLPILGWILVILLAIAGYRFFAVLFIVAILLGAALIYFSPKLNLEYEYTFVAGELTIDKIFDKSSRKQAGNFLMADMELMAPEGHPRLDEYKNFKGRIKDFTSGFENKEIYILVFRSKGEVEILRAECGSEIAEAIKMRYPSKVAR
ncbi:MAG: DUF6106 family protein [Lachnospiraceae bacterium]|nr:DUF6106 family protein [Lachnospiraceae bacterium]